MIKEAIVKIVNKEDLSYEEAYTVMNERLHLPRTRHFWQLFLRKAPEQKRPMRSQAVQLL